MYKHSLISVQNNSRYREGGFSEVNYVVPALRGLVFLRREVCEKLVNKRSGIV